MKKSKYNIIGDTHGRTKWKDLVLSDAVNVFVGDYFSPYRQEGIYFDDCLNTFNEILKYKEEHPETVLLLGNHDGEYWFTNDRTNRYDATHASIIKELFENDKDKFQVALSIKNKVLVTHAGVTKNWFLKYASNEDKKQEITPEFIADFINNIFKNENLRKIAFNFSYNILHLSDYSGESKTHGPLWIRPYGLLFNNVFEGDNFYQCVGHTMMEGIVLPDGHENNEAATETIKGYLRKVIFVDVLSNYTQSLIIEFDEEDKITFKVNNPKNNDDTKTI